MADAAEGLELGPRTIDVLAAFDGRLSAVASAVARGEYVFWLGSGLSRSVVPDVSELLRKLLSFLQQQVVPSNDACRFRRALNDILDISSIPQGMRDDIDLATAVESWPGVEDLVQRLVNQYSKALDVAVRMRSQISWFGRGSTWFTPTDHPSLSQRQSICASRSSCLKVSYGGRRRQTGMASLRRPWSV